MHVVSIIIYQCNLQVPPGRGQRHHTKFQCTQNYLGGMQQGIEEASFTPWRQPQRLSFLAKQFRHIRNQISTCDLPYHSRASMPNNDTLTPHGVGTVAVMTCKLRHENHGTLLR